VPIQFHPRCASTHSGMSDTPTNYYHGTSIEAALSIQRSGGFSLARSGSNAGTLLGDGIYYTGNLNKALGYAQKNEASGVILILNVNMGNCKVLAAHDPMMRTWSLHGFDSAHAPNGPSGCGGLSEYCVRDPGRITIVGILAGDTDRLRQKKMEICGNQLVHMPFSGQKHKIDDSPPASAGSAAYASSSPKYSSPPIPAVSPAFAMSSTPPVPSVFAVSATQPSLLSPKCSSRPVSPVPTASTTFPILKSFAELKTIPLLPLSGDQVERFCIMWSNEEGDSDDARTKGLPSGGLTRSCGPGNGKKRSCDQTNNLEKTCGLPLFGLGRHETTHRSDYKIFHESTSKELADRTKHAACVISTNCGLKLSNMCTLEMTVPPHLQNKWVDLAMVEVGDVYREKKGPFVVLSFETLHLLTQAMTVEAARMNWNYTVGIDEYECEVDVMGGFVEMPKGGNYRTYIDDVESRAPFMIKTTTANVVDANGNLVSNSTAHSAPCLHMPSQTMTTSIHCDSPAVRKGHFDLFRFVMNTANTP